MKYFGLKLMAAALACCAAMGTAGAQDAPKPAYLDTSLPAEKRAADLVGRLTLPEKASQLVNQSRAIPRLNVPAYDWWSESLHGVLTYGTTEFPEPVGLAATFDPAAIHKMAEVISTEGRIKNAQAVRRNGGHANIFEGLDFWAPNINIFRDPRWGRGQETYGEDPFLTGRMAVAFVTGMQGDDPRYYRTISTPKHFAVHSGPEPTRHTVDVAVSKHDELDTYLPAFRAAVTEGKAGSVMCAYNDVNGEPACANEFLLQDQLRGKWGFQGYVVSDCGAVIDIFHGHHFKPTQPEASAISLQRGMDNECVDWVTAVKDDHDYKAYLDAVKQGFLKESEIDTAVTRLFTARIKLGMFDPPEMVPYTKIDEKLLDSAAHRAMARKVADEAMVLLKNDGVLPLKNAGIKIALVGPLAEQTHVLLGNYNGTPTHTVSILEGMKKEFPGASIQYLEGTQFLSKSADPVPAALLSSDGKPGVKASYSLMQMDWGPDAKKPEVLASRVEPNINLTPETLPAQVVGVRPLGVRWEAMLTPQATGEYYLGLEGDGGFNLSIDGNTASTSYDTNGIESKLTKVHLEAGKPVKLEANYGATKLHQLALRLVWKKVDLKPSSEAIAAAKNADVVVAVVGITSELEGEEMPVHEEGFKGGDRTSIELPKPEEELIEALSATGKPLVVVLTNGSALGVNWAQAHADAILEAWYPGEEGGAAVAETLSGKNNPAGRLPVTFYKSVDQLPPFEDYAMKGRTYRYFQGEPLYPFGYGLSYTSFSYGGLTVPAAVAAGSPVVAEVTVTNTGKLAGDEVAQLYLEFPKLPGAPLRALRGFQRVHLEAGTSQKLRFELQPRDLSMVTEAGEPIVAEGQYILSVGGGQPHTATQTLQQSFDVKGKLLLPE
ncbi:MAG: glycoside hydrolase family 3 C-terminal domain-containing protein [Terracidiphilus sp.]